MSEMLRRALAAALCLVVLSTTTSFASTTSVDVVNYAYQPAKPKIALSNGILWHNTSDTSHTVTFNVPAVAPGSVGSLSPGKSASLTFFHGGAYAYHCIFHSQQVGTIKVKPSISPTSGTTSTNFTLRVATQNAASGFVQDVQRRKGSGSWLLWQSVTTQLVVFNPAPSENGTWHFRTRYRKTSTNEETGWSPELTVVVSQP
ncbi:MAG: Cupredoxin-like domain [Chloroflexota bacterium]|jgi:plastocyanin|nr:Cupredoxin-like domain [Chloroflexota bacterium]